MPVSVLAVLAAVVLIVATWRIVTGDRMDASFVVRVTGPGRSGVIVTGKPPGIDETDLAELVATLELPAGAKIWGIREHDGVRLRFSSEVPEGPRQRLRNVIHAKFR